MLYAKIGPKTRETVNEELTDTEQLQIMEAYAEAENNLFLDWNEDVFDFDPEE